MPDRFARRDIALWLLSVAAGGIDALGLNALGETMPSAMSGNTVLFGLALGQGRLPAASHSIVAFAGYAAGVAVATARPGRLLLLETLALAAFAGFWRMAGGNLGAGIGYALIVLAAFAMGVQAMLARQWSVAGVTTTVVTMTLTSCIASLAQAALRPEAKAPGYGTLLQGGVVLCYLAGAGLTGVLLGGQPALAALPPLAAVVLVLGLVRAGWIVVR